MVGVDQALPRLGPSRPGQEREEGLPVGALRVCAVHVGVEQRVPLGLLEPLDGDLEERHLGRLRTVVEYPCELVEAAPRRPRVGYERNRLGQVRRKKHGGGCHPVGVVVAFRHEHPLQPVVHGVQHPVRQLAEERLVMTGDERLHAPRDIGAGDLHGRKDRGSHGAVHLLVMHVAAESLEPEGLYRMEREARIRYGMRYEVPHPGGVVVVGAGVDLPGDALRARPEPREPQAHGHPGYVRVVRPRHGDGFRSGVEAVLRLDLGPVRRGYPRRC